MTVGYRASKSRRGESREIPQIILSRSAELMIKHGLDCDDLGTLCFLRWNFVISFEVKSVTAEYTTAVWAG